MEGDRETENSGNCVPTKQTKHKKEKKKRSTLLRKQGKHEESTDFKPNERKKERKIYERERERYRVMS